MKVCKPNEAISRSMMMLFLFLSFIALLASRRWLQWVSPQVWDEDGTPNPWLNDGQGAGSLLADFVHYGWGAFFDPVNDYFLFVPKLISALSLSISFSNYPFVGTLFSWLFIALVGLAIAYAPTHLRNKPLCAISVFLLPTDPEVFGLTIYTFWWTSLLLFLVALWDETKPALGLRLVMLIAAGLSSPIIVLILPVLYFRSWRYRPQKSELVVAFVATIIAAIQLSGISQGTASALSPLTSILTRTLPTFFGRFLLASNRNDYQWIAALIVLGLVAHWLYQNKRSLTAWTLVYLLLGSIAMVVVRVDVAIIHPQSAGPRYFFFPFVLLAWILIDRFHSTDSRRLRAFLILLACLALSAAIPVWTTRAHDDLQWLTHVRSCTHFERYAIPIHWDGRQERAWWLDITGQQCRNLIADEPLAAAGLSTSVATYPFTVTRTSVVDQTTWKSLVSRRIAFTSSQAELFLHLRRGDSVLYRSGPGKNASVTVVDSTGNFLTALPPSSNWVALEFSNIDLPDAFTVRFATAGIEDGDWLEFAFNSQTTLAR